jgi:competence protein ComEA
MGPAGGRWPIETPRSIGGAVCLVVVALAAGAWFGLRGGAPPPPGAPASGLSVVTEAPSATVTVHVSGAVARPGLVEIPSIGRVADAVASAGGALPDADLGGLNLAAPVHDGDHIVIASASGGPITNGGAVTDEGVRINQASEAELENLSGVGPVLAARIVQYREANGPFESPEDLLGVPGIGEAKLAGMRAEIVVP